jgi:hypothetical protein
MGSGMSCDEQRSEVATTAWKDDPVLASTRTLRKVEIVERRRAFQTDMEEMDVDTEEGESSGSGSRQPSLFSYNNNDDADDDSDD